MKNRLIRWLFGLYPCYRGTGGHVTFISTDFHEMHVKLPCSWRTKNYVGTTFGGSMYGCVDPIYMMMLIQILGPEYIVWDKSASIRFKKPGRSTLYARFLLEPSEIDSIRAALTTEKSIDRVYTIELKDAEGSVHAVIEKTLYIKKHSARSV